MASEEKLEVGEGVSNTPDTTSKEIPYATCIDYLKYRFDIDYEAQRAKLKKIFKILCLKQADFHLTNGINGYSAKLNLAPGISLWYGGDFTLNSMGDATCVLELKGSGCREFEDRFYSKTLMKDASTPRDKIIAYGWYLLMEEAKVLGGKCTRIDIPTDDFSGNITIEEIKQKIARREYTTITRRLEETKSFDKVDELDKRDEIDEVASIRDSKLTGYTATFGGRERTQLCIYDKLSERLSKGIDPGVKSWVRFEVRFYHQNAEMEVERLFSAIREGKQAEHIIGCLGRLFEFKEATNESAKNRNRAATWSKWEELMKHGKEQEGFGQTPKVLSIESNAAWMMIDAAKTFGRLYAALDVPLDEIATALIYRFCQRAKRSDLVTINQYRESEKLEPFPSIKVMKERLLRNSDMAEEFSKRTIDLLLKKKSKSEILAKKKEAMSETE